MKLNLQYLEYVINLAYSHLECIGSDEEAYIAVDHVFKWLEFREATELLKDKDE